VGGLLFNLLASAIGIGNPSIEELLLRQLERIAMIVEDALRQNEIRRDMARLESIKVKMIEYMNAPNSVDRLENATADSLDVFADLKSFGIQTYFETLAAGAIHLAVLQERFKRDHREQANYRVVIDSITQYHSGLADQIDRETGFGGYVRAIQPIIDKPILGYAVRDIDRIDGDDVRKLAIADYNASLRIGGAGLLRPLPPDFNPPRTAIQYDIALWGRCYTMVNDQISVPRDTISDRYISWSKFRTRVRQEKIVPGEKIIAKLRDSTGHLARMR